MRSSFIVCCLAVTSMLVLGGCNVSGVGGNTPTGGSGAGSGGSNSGGSGGTSSGGSGGTSTAAGGATSSGGTTATGGTTSSGGATSAGGTTGSGGTTSKGGTPGSGGATSAGGTTGSGGTTATGGTTGSGGSTAMGGATGGGGSKATGGATGSGGVSASGGSKATGGTTTGTGGATGTGGVNGTGGTTSTSTLAKFSFFVTSLKALQALAGSTNGFGGDLRYGETGTGAGLKGADKLCAAIAERSMAGSSAKQWRAFLSVTADANGAQVNAIDRIGNGPWYDRLGRTFATQKSELMNERPSAADAAIKYDFPNEDGVTNHNPDKTGNVDNHDMITGSNAQGTLYSATATCKDWTTSDGASSNGKPRVGHPWPTGGSTTSCGGGGGGMGGGDGSMCHWMSALDESGCGAGINLVESGGPKNDGTIGSGGGYGGFYCFALTP